MIILFYLKPIKYVIMQSLKVQDTKFCNKGILFFYQDRGCSNSWLEADLIKLKNLIKELGYCLKIWM